MTTNVWTLNHRSVHVVPRRDATGYTIRVRWSQKLGLQLDTVFTSRHRAVAIAQQIMLRGRIDLQYWKRIFNPKWSPTCTTLYSN